jgi:hypothetical protein
MCRIHVSFISDLRMFTLATVFMESTFANRGIATWRYYETILCQENNIKLELPGGGSICWRRGIFDSVPTWLHSPVPTWLHSPVPTWLHSRVATRAVTLGVTLLVLPLHKVTFINDNVSPNIRGRSLCRDVDADWAAQWCPALHALEPAKTLPYRLRYGRMLIPSPGITDRNLF